MKASGLWTAALDATGALVFTRAGIPIRFRVQAVDGDLHAYVSEAHDAFRPCPADMGFAPYGAADLRTRRTHPVRRFFDPLLPRATLREVAEGPAAWRLGALRVAMTPEGRDLAGSARALFWLAAARASRGMPSDSPAPHVKKPRREVLAWALGVQDVPQSRVRLLSKVNVAARADASVSPTSLLALARDAELAHALRHYPTIPMFAADLAAAPAHREYLVKDHAWMHQALLDAIAAWERQRGAGAAAEAQAQRSAADRIHGLIARYETVARAYRDHGIATSPLRRVSRARQLEKLLFRVVCERVRRAPEDVRFPRPPFRGTRDIQPIATAEELMAEGRWALNCVADFLAQAVAGEMFFYRVLSPSGERATLSLRAHGFGATPDVIRGDQLKAAGNREVTAATRDFVAGVLRRHGITAPPA